MWDRPVSATFPRACCHLAPKGDVQVLTAGFLSDALTMVATTREASTNSAPQAMLTLYPGAPLHRM